MAEEKFTGKPTMKVVDRVVPEDELFGFYTQFQMVLKHWQRELKTPNKNPQMFESIIVPMLKRLHDTLGYVVEKPIKKTKLAPSPQCLVCYSEFDSYDVLAMEMISCHHKMICQDCFVGYMTSRITDGEVIPWIPCPAEDCSVPVHSSHFLSLPLTTKLQFLAVFKRKRLVRNVNFIPCTNKECLSGFLQFELGKSQELVCKLCNLKQIVKRKTAVEDMGEDMKKLLSSGHLKQSPCCKLWTLKEKGICQIIQCSQCNVVWNFGTMEMGNSIREMKEPARSQGTLWQSGELEYQMKLQREKPSEFKALLQRNGIEFNPNYVRGS